MRAASCIATTVVYGPLAFNSHIDTASTRTILKFRPNSGDETICPCNYIRFRRRTTPAGLGSREGVVDARPRSPSLNNDEDPRRTAPTGPASREADRDARPWRLKTHTVKHILAPGHDACPLVSQQERTDILHNYSLAHIFSTEAGGRQLCLFLPPRPDC